MNLLGVTLFEGPNLRLLLFMLFIGLYSTTGCAPLLGQQKHPAGKTFQTEIKVYEATAETRGEPQAQHSIRFGLNALPN
jgi:hypothetical protein